MKAVYWFRNDLRIHDNQTLVAAAKADSLICIYVIDEAWFNQTRFGNTRIGFHKLKFLLEGLENLNQKLQSLGNKLIVKVGNPVEEVKNTCLATEATHLFYAKQMGFYESKEEEKLKAELTNLTQKKYLGQTLFHVNNLPFKHNKIPEVFTEFRKKVEKYSEVNKLFESPKKLPPSSFVEEITLPKIEDFNIQNLSSENYGGLIFKGGEDAALERLKHYFWQTEKLKIYKSTRNGLLGMDYSSKFSPWLAWGFISPRKIYWEIKKFEAEIEKNVSTYWLIFELLWRDFFAFTIQMHGKTPFLKDGINQIKKHWGFDPVKFEKWKNGKTGIPFVDANMRELNATGFMSNRGRQNVASFLVHDLKLDWRAGAEYFEQQLIDYDVCSNWGNWNYVAGIGNDPRENRWFNVVFQSNRYDAKAEYIKTWLPQLQNLPVEFAKKPWEAKPEQLAFANLELGKDYPNPIMVDERW
jgi:deoxyribodipyrimidine photo-lyase